MQNYLYRSANKLDLNDALFTLIEKTKWTTQNSNTIKKQHTETNYIHNQT